MKILHTTADLPEVEGAVQLGDLELLGHDPVEQLPATEELGDDHHLIPALEGGVEPDYLGVAQLLQNSYFVLDFLSLVPGPRPECSHIISVRSGLTPHTSPLPDMLGGKGLSILVVLDVKDCAKLAPAQLSDLCVLFSVVLYI